MDQEVQSIKFEDPSCWFAPSVIREESLYTDPLYFRFQSASAHKDVL